LKVSIDSGDNIGTNHLSSKQAVKRFAWKGRGPLEKYQPNSSWSFLILVCVIAVTC